MSEIYNLKAMAHNYRNGHSWDHLDSEVCIRAVEEIKKLQEERNEGLLRIKELEKTIEVWKGSLQSIESKRLALKQRLTKVIPDFIRLSPEMKEAGDREVTAARSFGCASVNALEAVFFEAAIQIWIDQQQEYLENSNETS